MGKSNLVLAGSIGMTLLGGGLLTPSGALGQEAEPGESSHGSQEIVVTARRREESIQEVPVSITSLSGIASSRRPCSARKTPLSRPEPADFAQPFRQFRAGLHDSWAAPAGSRSPPRIHQSSFILPTCQ